MRMPGNDIHEVVVFDPEERLQGEEFGLGLFDEGQVALCIDQVKNSCSGLLILEKTPERVTLGRSHGAVDPCGVLP